MLWDMTQTDWVRGFVGGVLIGMAGTVFLLVNGRIMGASGILGGLIDGSGIRMLWQRGAFVAGCVLAPSPLCALYRSVDTQTPITS
ncbi:hypothetical protein Ga0609869_000160 [Rhodovulum iodosum]|uniref:YeeE/YedE family protein n=1 Tax=Rhodovulum iodosum TaxID=68291 RepID=A0ABV3XQT0_9RHOB